MKFAVQNSYKTSLAFYMAGMPVIFLMGCVAYVLSNSLNPLMIGFLSVYAITVLFTVVHFGWISLYSIFLYTSAFFIYDCFIFTLTGRYNFLKQTFPITYTLPDDVGRTFIIVCVVCVYVMHLTYCLCKKSKIKREINYETRPDFVRCGKIIMLVFLIPLLAKIYIQVSYIRAHGYLSMYAEQGEFEFPFWVSGAFTFFISGFVLFLSGKPEKKELIKWSAFYFVVFSLSSLRGQRGPILSLLLFLLCLFVKKFSLRIKIRHLLMLLVVVIAFTYSLGNLRKSYGGNQSTKKSKINISAVAESVLYSQTTTRAIPLLIINGDVDYHPYPFIFTPITLPFSRMIWPEENRTEISGQKYNIMGRTLLYNVSKRAYLQGYGYGGAFIGEAYDCGGFIGLVFWSIFLAYICAFLDFSDFMLSPKVLPLVFLFLFDFGMLTRERLLAVATKYNYLIFIYFVILILNSKNHVLKIPVKGRRNIYEHH